MMKRSPGKPAMLKILLLLFAGVIPVLTQYNTNHHDYQNPKYSDYGDVGQYSETEEQQNQGSGFALQQESFFDKLRSGSVSYGGLTPPPPMALDKVNNERKYYESERRAIVPSSLRELEESYIRSLSAPSSSSSPKQFVGPFGEPLRKPSLQQNSGGLENFAGFIMSKRHYNKNDHIRSSHHQYSREKVPTGPSQSAPITYGFPLLNQHVSATNSIDTTAFGQKETNQLFDFSSHKNIVPNFPDFSDRPPIPEEPELEPPEEEVEEAITTTTSKPPETYNRNFPEPVLQRGFIPSFGPPTKPLFSLEQGNDEQELIHNQIASQVEVSTTSPVPVLRPELPSNEGGITYKHISVHVPPQDLEEANIAPKVIKVGKKPEKHIKVIFIKPPDSSSQKTEVQVPAGPQHKTLVYVLSESGGTRTPIKLVTPTPLKPAPPQVYFLRYTDPHADASHPTPTSSADDEDTDREESTEGPPSTPPIKQLANPLDPDAELLRSVPAPVLPTFPSGFSSPASAIAQQLALQSTLINANSDDPTNSKYHDVSSTNGLNSNKHLATAFSTNTNPFNQFSSLYHLYPPPTTTVTASAPTHNLLSLYTNSNNNYQQQQQYYRLPQQQSRSQIYLKGQSKSEKLHSGERNHVDNLVNNFSVIQERVPRNYVMMNYAPTYMPSASGSDHAPVFTSPAEFIKSLLGDSYMYYNNIANNSAAFYPGTVYYGHHPNIINAARSTVLTTTTTTSATTTTTTTPAPPREAQHHRIPLIFNWANFQNLSLSHTNSQPPLTLPVYPHLRPLFPILSTTTTPKPQQANHPSIITGNTVSAHLSKLYKILQQEHQKSNVSSDESSSEQSAEYNSQSESSSSESDEGSNQTLETSGEQVISPPNQVGGGGSTGYSSSIIYVHSNKNNNSSSNSTVSKRRNGRKRVNPAHVKPGRRLRKVRKPHKSRNSRNQGNDKHANI